MINDQHYPPQPSLSTGLAGRCPRCGQGRIFSSYLNLKERCETCGLDFGFADSADGPAVFIILILGFIVVAAAIVVEFAFAPPYWVHLVLWIPTILIVSIGMLKPLKGFMIALQYNHRAREGRLVTDDQGR